MIDIKKLKGEDLFYYIVDNGEREFAEAAQLLMYAEPDRDKALVLLEKMIQDGKRLVAIYPGNGDVPPKSAELVGDIPDGALYLV
ncbi:hypothetical protein JCM6292_767 [Bacteroides pyogenes JCM 6292]|uniref:Uncharacterized protein n=2 Tax=Bacteroides pyogenes TaxID=310300 RepID=W4PEI4_9BACE|nr:hypothetical protein [Bacteroides pyogenes]GAE14605.1 hypothetical protein JCM6292_767 [Bacteroides pyogenes JCM 6292]GAE18221.1 hypothetical protein JCM6294_1091 [Bacteroides pyogenes DSM 20611 = JCM 6294]